MKRIIVKPVIKSIAIINILDGISRTNHMSISGIPKEINEFKPNEEL